MQLRRRNITTAPAAGLAPITSAPAVPTTTPFAVPAGPSTTTTTTTTTSSTPGLAPATSAPAATLPPLASATPSTSKPAAGKPIASASTRKRSVARKPTAKAAATTAKVTKKPAPKKGSKESAAAAKAVTLKHWSKQVLDLLQPALLELAARTEERVKEDPQWMREGEAYDLLVRGLDEALAEKLAVAGARMRLGRETAERMRAGEEEAVRQKFARTFDEKKAAYLTMAVVEKEWLGPKVWREERRSTDSWYYYQDEVCDEVDSWRYWREARG